MFYHDHAYGITRLNVYAGEASGYLLTHNIDQGLITARTLPDLGIPLIIQDKSFVRGNSASRTGTYSTDPTWADVAPDSQPGDLWFPHVYVPNQDPFFYFSTTGPDGMNAMGRWDGPWIWPPAAVQVPDTLPNPSIVPEAFMDTMIVGKSERVLNTRRTVIIALLPQDVVSVTFDAFLTSRLVAEVPAALHPYGVAAHRSLETDVEIIPARCDRSDHKCD